MLSIANSLRLRSMKEREVILTLHTTCGIAFEVTDAKTEESLAFVDWCSDEEAEENDEKEGQGWVYMRNGCAQRGWKIKMEAWS